MEGDASLSAKPTYHAYLDDCDVAATKPMDATQSGFEHTLCTAACHIVWQEGRGGAALVHVAGLSAGGHMIFVVGAVGGEQGGGRQGYCPRASHLGRPGLPTYGSRLGVVWW